MRFPTRATDRSADHALTHVDGREGSYDCPDLAAVEDRIRETRARLARAVEHAPITAARLRRDVDALLDRYHYLRMTGTGGT